MKTLLPWLLVLGLGAGLAAIYVADQKKAGELAKAQAEAEALPKLHADLDDANNQIKVLQEELVGFQKDKEDLLRLRNQVRQLQQEKEQLTKQTETARTEVQRAQAQASQVAQTGAQQLQQLQTENQQLRTVTLQNIQNTQRNACINILRQLDGAKQQWALENSKTAEAVPTPQDIAQYMNNTMPSCPAGGTYTLNAAGQPPTCSIPGHVLPRAPAP